MSTMTETYQVCVTTGNSIAVYDVEGWKVKGGVLVPIYDHGKTYQDEAPTTDVNLFQGDAPHNPANTITFEELVDQAAAYFPCPESHRAEGMNAMLVCRLFEGHGGECEWVSV